jgi:hypothetical protein
LHPLDELESGYRFDWAGAGPTEVLELLKWCHAEGLALRMAPVGYGTALRVSVTDVEANTFGLTLGTGAELNALSNGLRAPGGREYVSRHAEPPRGRRKR